MYVNSITSTFFSSSLSRAKNVFHDIKIKVFFFFFKENCFFTRVCKKNVFYKKIKALQMFESATTASI
jgi:hypothetical protein